MPFDLETWKIKIAERLPNWRSHMERIGVRSTYAVLSAMTFWPLAVAVQKGDGTGLSTLATVLAGLGSNLLASYIDKWKDEVDAARQIEQLVKTEPTLRAELDVLLEKFDVFSQATHVLRDGDRQWFTDTLRAELLQFGDRLRADYAFFGLSDDLREAYLNWLIDHVRAVPLSGVDPTSVREETRRDLDLAAVYTALMTQMTKEKVGTGLSLGFDREQERISALTVLNQSPRLALLGDPGSGKSTFVNFVALCMAGELLGRSEANLTVLRTPVPDDDSDEKAQPQPWEHGPLLPLRVVLRDFVVRGLAPLGREQRVSGDTLWQFIVAELPETLREFADPLRVALLNQGGLLLLDGLDEVPEADERRVQVKTAVEQFSAAFPKVRVLVTSRTYAYQRQDWKLRNFTEAVLAPFGNAQIRRFVERWYAFVGQVRNLADTEAQGRAVLLNNAIRRNFRLFELATRPLLLTLMASLHAWRGGTLPEQREKLYDEAVSLLLHQWEDSKRRRRADGTDELLEPSLSEWLQVEDKDAMRQLLDRLAFCAHRDQPDLVGTADIAQKPLVNGLINLSPKLDVNPGQLIIYLRDRAGILEPRGVGVYAFPHRTFQEYLAACHLTRDDDFPENVADLLCAEPNRWREVTLLAGAKAVRGAAAHAAWALADALCVGEPPTHKEEDESGYWGALLAAQVLIENKIVGRVTERNRDKLERIRRWLTATLTQGALSRIDRALAGDALATIGDPRFRADAWSLPDEPLLGFVEVLAGPFLMGEGEKRHEVFCHATTSLVIR
ncbi:MAG: NACHT domain-containing NTPase [Candidatus Binatia bacterium]